MTIQQEICKITRRKARGAPQAGTSFEGEDRMGAPSHQFAQQTHESIVLVSVALSLTTLVTFVTIVL